MESQSIPYITAVVGAGPAGLFAARQLAEEGCKVILFNRDIKPGGLAEYGIYPEKYKMKEGLRKQFRQILDLPQVQYFGNISVGTQGDISLDQIKEYGCQSILVSAGAQGTKWMGIPGEDTPKGVYHAKDIVYHYNNLPPYSEKVFHIGKRVAVVGVGNVMMDITRWLARVKKVDEVIAIARRGPVEVKFDKKEMEYVVANLDQKALEDEINRVAPVMIAIGQEPAEAKATILAALPKAVEPVSRTRFRFDFLASPIKILGDETDTVAALVIENTTLIPTGNDTRAKSVGTRRMMEVDTVIFCIGDKVDDKFGLPVQWNEFVKSPNPIYPVDSISYEAFDPDAGKPFDGIFVAGWSREASSGLVGIARKDGERGARAMLQYLHTIPPSPNPDSVMEKISRHVNSLQKPVVLKDHLITLNTAELKNAEEKNLEDFKFKSNEEMFEVMGFN